MVSGDEMPIRRRTVLVGMVGAVATPMVGAVSAETNTLVVDDGEQCPDATYTSIQAAIDDANAGDTVEVCAGTYTESLTDFPDSLTLVSRSGPAKTVIDAPTGENAIRIKGSTVLISGFTIQSENARGIDIGQGASGTEIRNNSIEATNGKAIVSFSSVEIVDNTLQAKRGILLGSFNNREAGALVEDNQITVNGYAIKINAMDNIAVKNNTIRNVLSNGEQQGGTGVLLTVRTGPLDNTTIAGNSFENLSNGVFAFAKFSPLRPITGLTIRNNEFRNNIHGIQLRNEVDGTITGNVIVGSVDAGIEFTGTPDGSLIYDNLFNNTENVKGLASAGPNQWNVEPREETNIIGGPLTAGNFYAHPDGTGFSEQCDDHDRDGICDTPNDLGTESNANTDFHPLTMLDIPGRGPPEDTPGRGPPEDTPGRGPPGWL